MSTSEKKKTRRKFTPEFKLQAVKRVLAGHPVAAVARELGIGESLLHNWVTRHRLTEGGGAAKPCRSNEGSTALAPRTRSSTTRAPFVGAKRRRTCRSARSSRPRRGCPARGWDYPRR
ncbi:MAG: transposase [Candidatus Competibacteraceae bacterium]|nr:transposase [Candidatus Competibacteraceae bacterium]